MGQEKKSKPTSTKPLLSRGTGSQSLHLLVNLRTGVISSTFRAGGWVSGSAAMPQLTQQGISSPPAELGLPSIARPPLSLPTQEPSLPTARKLPDHPVDCLSPPPAQSHTPPVAFLASRMGPGMVEPEFSVGFMPWLVMKEASFPCQSIWGSHTRCKAQALPGRGRSGLPPGTHREASPNLSPRSSLSSEPE